MHACLGTGHADAPRQPTCPLPTQGRHCGAGTPRQAPPPPEHQHRKGHKTQTHTRQALLLPTTAQSQGPKERKQWCLEWRARGVTQARMSTVSGHGPGGHQACHYVSTTTTTEVLPPPPDITPGPTANRTCCFAELECQLASKSAAFMGRRFCRGPSMKARGRGSARPTRFRGATNSRPAVWARRPRYTTSGRCCDTTRRPLQTVQNTPICDTQGGINGVGCTRACAGRGLCGQANAARMEGDLESR